MKKIYEWRLESFAKGVKANQAVKELNRIDTVYGGLTPENILEASKDNNALFHELFTWDDSEAANLYRLQQARKILNNVQVIIISDGEEKTIPVYEVVNVGESRVYKHIDDFTPDDIEQIKERTIRDLNVLRTKLSLYNQFTKAVKKLDEAVKIVSKA